MFTVDLLKGEGVPEKYGLKVILLGAVTFAIPVIVAIIIFGSYLTDTISIAVYEKQITGFEGKTNQLADALELKKSVEQEQAMVNSCLSEVSTSIIRYTQWSPILVEIAENMPDDVIMTELEVKQYSVKTKVPKKDEPEIMVEITVPARTLQISVCGSAQYSCDKAVRDFRDRLRYSDNFGPKLETVSVSQNLGKIDSRDVVSYEIDCVLKPQL